MNPPRASLSILSHPYRALRPVTGGRETLREPAHRAGSALVWRLGDAFSSGDQELVRCRPGGMALILILPPAARLRPDSRILHVIETARPCGILPHHEIPDVEELSHVLRRPPTDLPADITDYLLWRGIAVSREARQIIRRTVELSAEIRSIHALSRGMYLSRRALGRRFEAEGLPVPSHWLHFSRLLRVILRLQNSDESVVAAGFKVGYPDGFSLSNQMFRLTGYRPTEARQFLGWEWFLEAWLRTEAEAGGLRSVAPAIDAEHPQAPPSVARRRSGRRGRARESNG